MHVLSTGSTRLRSEICWLVGAFYIGVIREHMGPPFTAVSRGAWALIGAVPAREREDGVEKGRDSGGPPQQRGLTEQQ